VVAWLEREGLGTLCSIAVEQGFDGGTLLALHSEDPHSFKDDCNGLGIKGLSLQPKFKGRLVALFG